MLKEVEGVEDGRVYGPYVVVWEVDYEDAWEEAEGGLIDGVNVPVDESDLGRGLFGAQVVDGLFAEAEWRRASGKTQEN